MEDKNNKNTLSALFTDEIHTISPKELVAILQPYLAINRSNNKLLFTPEGLILNARKKIILFLLARKALLGLGVIKEEAVAPKDIKAEFQKNIPGGTIDFTVKQLSDKGIIKGDDGKYFIPDFNFPKIQAIFADKNKEK